MPIARLLSDRTAVLIIDVQERLLPTIVDADRVVTNAAVLVRLAEELDLPYLVTEQYPRGLGRTAEPVTQAMTDPSQRIEKTRFSALVDLVDERLQAWGASSVLVGGLEAHVCVCQSVLDLQASGRQCFLCTDAISAGQRDQIAPAYQRMQAAGAIPCGLVAAMYELMGDARHPSFKACLELAKRVEH